MHGKLRRLHHRYRLAYRRRFYWHRGHELTGRDLNMVIDTPKPCSCVAHGCGNPRQLGERTVREIQEDEWFRLELTAYGLHPNICGNSWKRR